MTRAEQILKPLSIEDRVAIAAALAFALHHKQEFEPRYGTFSYANVHRVLCKDVEQ